MKPTYGQCKRILLALAVLGALIVQTQLGRLQVAGVPAANWSDSSSYRNLEQAISEGRVSEFIQMKDVERPGWQHNRTPLYPLFLLAHSKFFGPYLRFSPTQLSFFFNFVFGVLLLFYSSTILQLALSTAYFLLIFSSMMLSYQNTILSESILPGVLALSVLLSTAARNAFQKKNYRQWRILLAWVVLILAFYKPSYRLYPLGLLGIYVAEFLLQSFKRKQSSLTVSSFSFQFFLLSFSLIFFLLFFLPAGNKARNETKTDTLVYELLPRLGQTPPREIEFNQELVDTYNKLYRCVGTVPQNRIAHDVCDVPIEQGARVYDELFWPYFGDLLRSHSKKMFNVVKYAAWGWDQGELKGRAGIPKGFGPLGLFSSAVALALLFIALARRLPEKYRNANSDRVLLTELFLLAGYGFTTVFFGSSTDLGRLSLTWVLPAYGLLIGISFGIMKRLMSRSA